MQPLNFETYHTSARKTAFFLELPDSAARFDKIRAGFDEEVNEFICDDAYEAELTSLLWGWTIDPFLKKQLSAEKTAEAGDVLYYLAGAAMLHDLTVADVAQSAVRTYCGRNNGSSAATFCGLDALLEAKQDTAVPDDYSPNYFEKQYFGLPPFHADDGTHRIVASGEHDGPLRLTADGRYAADQLSRRCEGALSPFWIGRRGYFLEASGLMLGGLSIILQNRFDSSLEAAAQANLTKISRRLALGTLRGGTDSERSRPGDQPRPLFNNFDNTLVNLLFADRPALPLAGPPETPVPNIAAQLRLF